MTHARHRDPGGGLLISQRIESSRVSGTVRMAETAKRLRDQGRDIIDLSEGEPDFPTPPHVIAAAHAAALAGKTKYTPVAGTPELRAAVARKFRKENNLEFKPDEIVVGTGAKQLVFNALMSTLERGDEVIIPAPYWVSYPEIVEIAGGKPVIVRTAEHDDFKLRPDALEAAINEKTRWLILNSPGNPSGAVYASEELGQLADVVRQHAGIGILTDEIYEKIVFDGSPFQSFGAVAMDLRDRTLTVNGVSKTYAMTGWRIGYAGGPRNLIAAMVKLQGQSTTNASSIGQAAALAALTGPQDFLPGWLEHYVQRRNLVERQLSDIPGLRIPRPEGAFYLFLDCRQLLSRQGITRDTELAEVLIEQAGVVTVPGSEFGTPGYIRICFARPEADLEAACSRISDILHPIAARTAT
ncbi:MAG: pyridoxal phosphate-dependent aminotransferase [Rhodobacteraceae bacterium]|nr:pyridoxal phosphate-dependent aminotransferase [Paracoccaceae bacterium]